MSISDRSSMTGMPGLVIAMTEDGVVQDLSADAARFLGPERLRKKANLMDFVHVDDRGDLGDRLAMVATDGRVRARFRMRRNDDVYRCLDGQVAHGLEGRNGRIVLNALDVTPYYRNEAQLRSMIEGSVQGLVLHRGGNPLFCNSAMVRMVGFDSIDQLLREPSILPFIHADDRDRVMTNVKARLAGQPAPSEYEFRLVTRSGDLLWVECRASVIDWDDKPAVLAACFDITDRKRAEAARQTTEALFARVFEASPDCLTLTRYDDGMFVNVNNGFLRMFGFTHDEVVGKTALDLGVWASVDDRNEVIAKLQADGVINNFETRGQTRNGELIDILVSAELLSFEDDRLILLAARDIADRKAYETELRASKEAADLANRSKSEFLANMSHELRTPLNAVLGFSDIIRNQMHGDINEPKYVEYARDIHESGTHLLEIINDILDLSKIEAGRLEVYESDVCMVEVVANCVRLIEARALDAGVIVKTAGSPELPLLLADQRLMKQILLNLLSNAVKFTPPGGVITVDTILNKDGELAISVTDTGIGMDQEGIERALQPFGQVDTSLSRTHQGSGLGLPLVVAFTERQGGTFALESTVGKGTCVTISFPAHKLIDRD